MRNPYWRSLKITLLTGLAAGMFAPSAFAIDKAYEPYVEKGEAELEYSGFHTFDSDKSKNNQQDHEIEFGYAPTDYWAFEIGGGFTRSSGESMKMDSVEFENKFQLYQPGAMWLDTGILLSYAHALHEGDPDAIEAKLLLQKNIGRYKSLMNVGLEQGIGHDNHGGPDVSLLWNNRYRYNQYFEPGIEIQSDFGQTNQHENLVTRNILLAPLSMASFSIPRNMVKFATRQPISLASPAPRPPAPPG